MEKTTAGLLGVIAGLATMGSAEAASNREPAAIESMQVASYADLLKPIPNASALLRASDAELTARAAAQPHVQLVQDYDDHHHHHHHHHHSQWYYAPPPPPPVYYHHHHHHHHHHSGVTIVVPGVGAIRTN